LDYLYTVLLPQVVDGLVIASALILVALGLTLIFGLLRIINIAHGELYMLGAYVAFSIASLGGSFWLGLIVAPVVVGLVGVAIERLCLKPLMKRRDHAVLSLLLTYGLSLILRDFAHLMWGLDTQRLSPPIAGALNVGSLAFSNYRLLVFAMAAVAIASVWWILYRTMAGAVLRATAFDQDMVAALGIPVRRVQMGTFFAGSALAAVAGVLLAPIYAIFPGMGHDFVLLAFAVIIVGGVGSVGGAVVAGLLLVQVQSLGSLVMRPVWAETLVYAVMIAVLVVRPNGLFNRLGA
jgi:branched-chain amino acid transport system permease protein